MESLKEFVNTTNKLLLHFCALQLMFMLFQRFFFFLFFSFFFLLTFFFGGGGVCGILQLILIFFLNKNRKLMMKWEEMQRKFLFGKVFSAFWDLEMFFSLFLFK